MTSGTLTVNNKGLLYTLSFFVTNQKKTISIFSTDDDTESFTSPTLKLNAQRLQCHCFKATSQVGCGLFRTYAETYS